jgi:hypothetical protein
MLVSRSRAVSGIAVAIIVIVLVAAGGVALYFVTMPGMNNNTTNSNSNSQSSTGTHSTTSSGSATSTSSSEHSSGGTTQSTSSAAETTSTSQYTCTTSSFTNETTQDQIQSVLNFVEEFKGMTLVYYGNTNVNGSVQTFNFTTTYTLESSHVSGGVTTYKIGVTYVIVNGSQSYNSTIISWVQSTGTVLAVQYGYGAYQFNETGSTAESLFVDSMFGVVVDSTYLSQITTYTGYQFQSSGPMTESIGSTSLQVTTYTATPPVVIAECGVSETLNAFTMKVGVVSGTSIQLITYLDVNVTDSSGTTDFTLSVTSLTRA